MKAGNFLLSETGVPTSSMNGEKGMKTPLFFFVLFFVQIAFIFQGVDVGDGGSYASFYQQIFDNPESVQYSFMFWLSGVVGGLYLKLFSGLGIWGIRLAGVIVSTGTIILSYNLLKRYLNKGYLQVSLFILTLFANNNPKDLYYNNLSSLIYIGAIYFLFTGLRNQKFINIMLSGILVSLNVFNRLPNILGLGLIAGILFYGYLYGFQFKEQLKYCFLFLLGFFACSAVVLVIMQQMGHLQFYLNALKLIFSMGKEVKQTDGLDSNYGLAHLIQILYWHYKFSIIAGLLFFLFVLVAVPAAGQIKQKYPSLVTRIIFSKYPLLLFLVFLVIVRDIDNISILYLFTGISLLAGCAILLTNKNKEISLLMFLGCFFAVIHPVGSSTGIHTVIIYSLWIAFPIALEYIFNITDTNIDLKIAGKHGNFYFTLAVNRSRLLEVRDFGIGMAIFACLFYSFFYPYFDKSNRLSMHYAINSKYMRGIYTSRERATALNELLAESARYVKPNDYVLAYDCIPLYHYLTETKPYLRNPWPWLYQPEIFKMELDKSTAQMKSLPVVVFQMVRTMGPNGGKWPDFSVTETTLNWNLNKRRNEVLQDFLDTHHYKEVWANKAFKILLPPAVP